jgi:hypothetical protein
MDKDNLIARHEEKQKTIDFILYKKKKKKTEEEINIT